MKYLYLIILIILLTCCFYSKRLNKETGYFEKFIPNPQSHPNRKIGKLYKDIYKIYNDRKLIAKRTSTEIWGDWASTPVEEEIEFYSDYGKIIKKLKCTFLESELIYEKLEFDNENKIIFSKCDTLKNDSEQYKKMRVDFLYTK